MPPDLAFLKDRSTDGSNRVQALPPQAVQPSSASEGLSSERRMPVVAIVALVVVAVLLAGASALWVHYGTAVFFETIAAGIAACF